MERYKLDKNIENQKLQIQIFFEQYKEARNKLKELLAKRKGMASCYNKTDYHEEEIPYLFDSSRSGSSSISDTFEGTIADLNEINQHLTEQVKAL